MHEEIHYAGDVLYTGTDISRALLEYARALAAKGSSATVDIPVYRADGTRGTSEFLIGAASQVVTESFETEWEELVDQATVERLEVATNTVNGSPALPVDSTQDEPSATFADFGEL